MIKMHVVPAVGNGIFWASVAATLWIPRLLRAQAEEPNQAEGAYSLPVIAVIIGVLLHLLIKNEGSIPTTIAWEVWAVTYVLTSALLLGGTHLLVLNEGQTSRTKRQWRGWTGVILPVAITLSVGLPVGVLYNFFAVEMPKAKAEAAADKAHEAREQAADGDGDYSDVAVMAAAQASVKAKLTDPDSAEFRNLYVREQASHTKAVCGEVNARNRAGGYNGFQHFISAGTDDHTWLEEEVPDFASAWNSLCVGS
ncbi:MAG: hypothetical protein ACM3YN_07485 [Parcubacteria group bacterium]